MSCAKTIYSALRRIKKNAFLTIRGVGGTPHMGSEIKITRFYATAPGICVLVFDGRTNPLGIHAMLQTVFHEIRL